MAARKTASATRKLQVKLWITLNWQTSVKPILEVWGYGNPQNSENKSQDPQFIAAAFSIAKVFETLNLAELLNAFWMILNWGTRWELNHKQVTAISLGV